MNSPFRKAGCDCKGCVVYGEHQDPNEFRGWHYITVEHPNYGGLPPHITAAYGTVSCRCGWLRRTQHEAMLGLLVAQHRAEAVLA